MSVDQGKLRPHIAATELPIAKTKKIGNEMASKKVDSAKENIYIYFVFPKFFEKKVFRSNNINSNDINPKMVKPTGNAR